MKRSGEPPLWIAFGAGGMLSALIGWMLVLLTGIGGVAPGLVPARLLDHGNALAVAAHPLGKAFLFAVVAFFLWHGAHRIRHSLHDLGIASGRGARLACYGVAAAGTLGAVVCLAIIGT